MVSERLGPSYSCTLEEILETRKTLESFLEERGVRNVVIGAVGRKGDYGIVVYSNESTDFNYVIPVQIDGVPVRVAKIKETDRIQPHELQALAKWYDTHCAMSGDPILQGPCHSCGRLGSWETDPYLEETEGREEWNFWCEVCYTEQ